MLYSVLWSKERFDMKKLMRMSILIFLAACTSAPHATGMLTGHVSIGPLTPVQQIGVPTPTPAPEVYAARQIVIYAADGQTEVAKVAINAKGDYQVTLAVGTYWVDINHAGMDRGIDLPQKVEILAGQTTRLDISIDTGIR
jgi:hypothetical protein